MSKINTPNAALRFLHAQCHAIRSVFGRVVFMDVLFDADWIALFVLGITCLVFEGLYLLTKKISWTAVLLIALVAGLAIGVVFSFDSGAHLVWLQFIGDAYVNIITALVAPVILVSVLSGFISLGDKSKMKTIGVRSVVWLLVGTAVAGVLTLVVGLGLGLGNGAESVFAGINSVSDTQVQAYDDLKTSFDKVLLALVPTNIVGDMSSNNVVAIIIIAIALAVAYVSVASEEGEQGVRAFKDVVEAFKKVIYRVLKYVIRLTPYAALCLIATSAGQFIADQSAMLQLLFLVLLTYVVGFVHAFIVNIPFVKWVAKLPVLPFFKKILPAQITAFTTQSSVGTLPICVENLVRKVGVDEEIANFTAPLGTTIGMPGCTTVWPMLLVIFYVNAMGLGWGFGDYLVAAVLALTLSLGMAGVPGIGVVSAVSLFSALGLPTAAVILMLPINTVTDMVRTMENVTNANLATAIVARQTGLLDDGVFNAPEKAEA